MCEANGFTLMELLTNIKMNESKKAGFLLDKSSGRTSPFLRC